MADEKRKGSKILFCACEHEFQDKEYGKNMRAHNSISNEKKPAWRCTVCGKERDR
jgi:hypothetical protein